MSGNLSVVNMLSIQGELDTTRTLQHSSNESNKELLSRIKELEEEKEAYKEHFCCS
jgi:ACT domain-containing protein